MSVEALLVVTTPGEVEKACRGWAAAAPSSREFQMGSVSLPVKTWLPDGWKPGRTAATVEEVLETLEEAKPYSLEMTLIGSLEKWAAGAVPFRLTVEDDLELPVLEVPDEELDPIFAAWMEDPEARAEIGSIATGAQRAALGVKPFLVIFSY